MLLNYLKVAVRTLMRNRLISFINIFGLGLSMSVGMMVMIRLQDQLGYDNFHPYPATTYRILSDYHKSTGEHWKMASTPLPLQDKLAGLSGTSQSVSVYPAFNGKAVAAGKEIYINGAFTGPSFFSVFGFSLSAGNPSTALSQPNAVVISKTTAAKYFGKETAIGEVINMENGSSFIITGILNEPPGKSHLQFDALASIATVPQLEKEKMLGAKSADWHAFNAAYTYVTLTKGYSPGVFNRQLNIIAGDLNKNNKDGNVVFALQPVTRITPGWDFLHNDRSGSSWGKFYFEIMVALIILLAACFNYTNLTIARSLTRAKEVGIRKINGAKEEADFLAVYN
ncbi:MAG: ABC transporter permease [Luteolibacter sp.]